ncbi:hypothetical protein I6N90_10655 [Paenibacillus sp. GSMTC-2017]|uniref:DUF2325 domain-containing protein n=1 Tax=Paenibacillus sp. GSMTC-2017 TaxID=2794350 RepID=UPI0018D78476|nr:DUF2325 domain-containing protein [Paenibacillus sp. GSMTC-2017]MBH5318269.1 hypothetical protein [Paenibacillus sp. GSMTC-2017]
MNMKMRARIAGLVDSVEWTKGMDEYRTILERLSKLPLPDKMILLYVKELDEKDKLTMALALEFPFAKRELRKWPEMLFVKMFRTSVIQAHKDMAAKRRLLLAILHTIPNLSQDEEESFTTLLEEQEQRIAKHGFWTFYWTIYFHVEKDDNDERWTEETKRLSERKNAPLNEDTLLVESAITADPPKDAEQNKQKKKITRLEGLYAKETAHRQLLEQDLVLRNKQLRMKTEELDRLNLALERRAKEIALAEAKNVKLTDLQQERDRRWKQEQDAWLTERQMFLSTIRSLNNKQNQLESTIESHTKELFYHNKDKAFLKQSIANIKEKMNDQNELVTNLKLCLYQEIEKIASTQINATDSRFGLARARIRKALDLADALEDYQALDILAEQPPEHDTTQHKSKEPLADNQSSDAGLGTSAKATTAQKSNKGVSPPPQRPEEIATPLNGTFYRRDHGGFIKLENDITFNITESLVYQHELQHEAEVLCTPIKHNGTSFYYEVQLLFQGDDSYSPVQQFDGYISLEKDGNWYCVDMNDANNRFHIHYKDIEIQKPAHGDPCTFNVFDGGHIARLTKLYRLNTNTSSTVQDKSAHPAELEPSRYRQNRDKRNEATQKTKIEPFLRGSSVTIVGGLRKWFEEVVLECGAELVHENGEHPERIHSDLKRSQALFLLISSTSHRATWESIEIAKAHGIPHFVIQGSKSNLRMLLWDNRELIKSANRH